MKGLFVKVFVSFSCLLLAGQLFGQSVDVANVEELYSAVNDPANAGAIVQMAPGTYALSALGPGSAPRPNGGRLELQEKMSLVGVVGDRSAVLIEAGGLPASSLTPIATVPTGAIRTGRGSNSLEWFTIRGAVAGQGNLVTGLTYSGPVNVRFAHLDSSGANNNLSIFNFSAAQSDKTLEVDIVDNWLHDATGNAGQGFRIGNFSGAARSVVTARLNGNRVWGNKFSLIVNNGPIDSTVNVFSAGNRYFDNGLGLLVTGGLNSNGNTVNFEGHGDRYYDNNNTAFLDRGGFIVSAGENFQGALPNRANNNTANVALYGCRFSNNQLVDLAGYGARTWPNPAVGPPGVNNHTTIRLIGMGSKPFVEEFLDVVPADPATTNSVTVIR
jgi:hypothetical protein